MEFEKELLAGGRYREQNEIDEWRTRDPIERFGKELVQSGKATQQNLDEIGTRVTRIVDEAVAFSHASEPADTELVFDLMFAGQKP
jgi:TPP-dependent pyruvate/acetoin dehydrogenase alpha subunit